MEEEFLSSEQLISDLLLWFWTANSANVPYGFTKQTFQLCCHSGSQKKIVCRRSSTFTHFRKKTKFNFVY